ncbi:ABC transporter substrate-binding protein [Alteribacillus sp. YIM 98480]|uniref:ABC transporter substrate-binding protein n=1 Tax=Alteribacillus sp. YIM 98480 TaxID=2606599 RepID=UPI00131A635A|nr:ABC transporter substrate-binding protein [Alteribacillus sp. YIM 98480]
MMKWKSTYLFILSLGMIIFLTACGGESEQTGSDAEGNNSDGGSTGEEVRGVTDDEIIIGNIVAQSGPQAIYGQIAQGIQTYFDYVNENGGVHGRQLKLLAYDGEYTPAVEMQQAQRLVEEEEVFLMLGNDCTPCNTATKEYYEEQGVINMMLGSGAQQFYEPPSDFFFGSEIANYRIETRVFYDYAVNELDAGRIAIVYQNDDYGKEGYEAVEAVRDDYDAEVVTEVPFVANEEDYTTHAQKVKDADVDTVIMLSTPNPAARLKQEFHAIGLTDINYIVSSVGGNDTTMFELAGEDVWEGTYSAGSIPVPDAPEAEGNEAIETYLEQYTEAYPGENYSGVPQWGYAGAEVFVEALERAGEDLNYDTFREALYSFDNWTEGTYAGVTFSPENHYGLTTLFMTRAQNGTIESVTDLINYDPETGEINYE